mmetsp:Transcript_8192/g.11862  ORF Transcript_8192/g.11862 Transcript_8192/m.11862 type:complete len:89 (+) Transcript_8192:155-421(+)
MKPLFVAIIVKSQSPHSKQAQMLCLNHSCSSTRLQQHEHNNECSCRNAETTRRDVLMKLTGWMFERRAKAKANNANTWEGSACARCRK